MFLNDDGFSRPAPHIERIAIDLTPVKPGGENGGAKLLALELTKQFAEAHPQVQFTILTTKQNHPELSFLDRLNVRRECVTGAEAKNSNVRLPLRFRIERAAARVLPPRVKALMSRWVKRPATPPPPSPLMEALGAQLLFCPFTAPFHSCASAATISVVHDLQYLTYPQFFRVEDCLERDRHFRWACKIASKIICPSEYVRETVIRHGGVSPERVIAVANTLQTRLQKHSADEMLQRISRWNLIPESYLLYPANFWCHKNHEMLVVAYGMFRRAHPTSTLKLVLTGAPDQRQCEVRETVRRLGLAEHVVMPGFVDEPDFAAILQGCMALVFPSLYEGFGMPVLEAMAMGKAVLCGNRTALPEVAGTAAERFDPRSPYSIAAAIGHIADDSTLVERYSQAALARAAMFGSSESMARKYWDVFERALTTDSPVKAGV